MSEPVAGAARHAAHARGPDDVVGGRYRLDHQVASGESFLWCAEDTILARPVALRLLPDSATPAIRSAFLAAAARAGQATGTGIVSVLDADTEPEPAAPATGAPVTYLVTEWVDGESLAESIRRGPLSVGDACRAVWSLCETVAGAHAAGVFSRRLHPGQVISTAAANRPRLTDLEVAAALHADPRLVTGSADALIQQDTEGLGRILYAAVTGCWPDPGWTAPWEGLPPAPLRDGRLCLPRQVRAGLPRELDLVLARTLTSARPDEAGRITTPEQLQTALSAHPALAGGPREPVEAAVDPAASRRRRRTIRGLVAALWLVALIAAGWLSGLVVGRVPGTSASAPRVPGVHAGPSASAAAAERPVTPAKVTSFDPQRDKTENETDVPNAVDGDPATFWITEHYQTAQFGGLKTGVGLLVDLGAEHAIRRAAVSAPAGETIELLAAPGAAGPPTSDSQTTPVTPAVTTTGQSVDLVAQPPQRARWYVLWITGLAPYHGPDLSSGAFTGQINELAFFE